MFSKISARYRTDDAPEDYDAYNTATIREVIINYQQKTTDYLLEFLLVNRRAERHATHGFKLMPWSRWGDVAKPIKSTGDKITLYLPGAITASQFATIKHSDIDLNW